MELLLVSVASLFAGFVDSIVGGGGLILVPALFAVFPNTHPATLFGVNKGASIWGTGVATIQYAQRVQMPWRALLPAAAVCFVGSMLGAWTVTVISPDFLRRALPLVLLGVLLYTLARKDLGRHHTPHFTGRQLALAFDPGEAITAAQRAVAPCPGDFPRAQRRRTVGQPEGRRRTARHPAPVRNDDRRALRRT